MLLDFRHRPCDDTCMTSTTNYRTKSQEQLRIDARGALAELTGRFNVTAKRRKLMLDSLPADERTGVDRLPTEAGRQRYARVRLEGHGHLEALRCGTDLDRPFEDLR